MYVKRTKSWLKMNVSQQMPHSRLRVFLPNVNSFAGDTGNFYPKMLQSMQRSQRPARLQYGFAVLVELLAHLTGTTIRDGALSCDDDNSKFLSEKEISIISYLPGYLFGTFLQENPFFKIWLFQLCVLSAVFKFFNGRRV